jgi:hypothetical protein
MIGVIPVLGTAMGTPASLLVETVAAEKEQAEGLQVTVRRLEAKIDRLAAQQGTNSTRTHRSAHRIRERVDPSPRRR